MILQKSSQETVPIILVVENSFAAFEEIT